MNGRPVPKCILVLRAALTILFASLLLNHAVHAQPLPVGTLKKIVSPAVLPAPEVGKPAKLSQVPSAEDDLANQTVMANLIQQSPGFGGVNVAVAKGSVLLEGQIASKTELQRLISIADRLPNVVAVVNNVQLAQADVTDLSPLRQEFNSWFDGFQRWMPRFVLGLIGFFVFFFVSGILFRTSRKLWSYRIQNPFMLSTVARFSLLPIYLIMFYVVLLTMGWQNLAATILGGTGVLGLVLGLAFKGIVENFFSGILLATRSPFTKGDLIEIDEFRGIVQNLNMRGTTIMDNDGTLILIPNTMVVNSVIQNYTASPKTRNSFTISLPLETSVTDTQKILLAAMKGIDRVLPDPVPLVMVDEFTDSVLKLKVYFWFDIRSASLVGSKSRVMAACKEALHKAGISMQNNLRVAVVSKDDPPNAAVTTSRDEPAGIEQAHDEMMKGTSPEESLKRLAAEATLPGNAQSPDLLKTSKDKN